MIETPAPYLLIVYGFPPNPGIGGRRWAKFARALAEAGHTVHVITVEPYEDKKSHWWHDVQHERIQIYYLNAHYPEVVLRGPQSIWEKVKYRSAISKLKRDLKGSIYDKAAYWQKPLTDLATKLMDQHGIQHVVASAAPFNIPVIAAGWKKDRSEMVLVSDLRDPWLENKHYGMQGLTDAQRKFEEANESRVIAESDLFTVPVMAMAEYYREKYPEHASKVHVLPHAYDAKDFEDLSLRANPPNKPLRFVYGGTLGLVGMDVVMTKLIGELSVLKEKSASFTFDFYTHTPIMQQEIESTGVTDFINYRRPVPVVEYLSHLNDADCCLLFLSEYNKDWMITKFCEFLPLRKPILAFAEEGVVSRFVLGNRLGYHFDPNAASWQEQLQQIMTDANDGWPDFNHDFDHSSFSTESVVEELKRKIESSLTQRK